MTELKQNAFMIHQDNKRDVPKKGHDVYRIEENDILLITGPHSGKRIRELWEQGSDEDRDYVNKIYKQGDADAMRIIKSLFCI